MPSLKSPGAYADVYVGRRSDWEIYAASAGGRRFDRHTLVLPAVLLAQMGDGPHGDDTLMQGNKGPLLSRTQGETFAAL